MPWAHSKEAHRVLLLRRLAQRSDRIPHRIALVLNHIQPQPEIIMGKYLLGWVLGVPAIVLVVAYFFFH